MGPVFHRYEKAEAIRLLESCYETSLELLVGGVGTSIAFSAISTGIYGFPSRLAARAAARVVRDFLSSSKGSKVRTVVFCCFEEKDDVAYKEILP